MISPDLLRDIGQISPYTRAKGIPADGNLHGVVFRLHVQSSIFQCFDHSIPSVKSFHSLSKLASGSRHTIRPKRTDLELLTCIFIECSIIVQDIDKLQFVTHADVIIIRIVGWGDFNSASSKSHVHYDRIRHDGKAALEERMHSECAMKVLFHLHIITFA
jgi:hypothetical protein